MLPTCKNVVLSIGTAVVVVVVVVVVEVVVVVVTCPNKPELHNLLEVNSWEWNESISKFSSSRNSNLKETSLKINLSWLTMWSSLSVKVFSSTLIASLISIV